MMALESHASGTPGGEGMPAVFDLLRERAGLVFSEARRPSVEAALERARTRAGVRNWTDYRDLLATDAEEFSRLSAELTIGESYFFRDPAQFELLRDDLLPSLARARGTEPIHIWSAGCASGEEPYSIAILCLELGLADRVRILGTDISAVRLQAARRGRYTRWSLRGVSDDVVARYFTRRDLTFELRQNVRRMVEWRQLNLADTAAWARAAARHPADLIVCRNVLIYLDAVAVSRVAGQLIRALSDDGWLLLGASDPLVSDYVSCHVAVTSAGLAYRRAGATHRAAPGQAWSREQKPTSQISKFAEASMRSGAAVPTAPTGGATPKGPEPPPAMPHAVSGDDLFAAAVRARDAADHTRAAELLQHYVQQGGSHIDAHALLVRSLANRGAFVEALDACASAAARFGLSEELAYLQSVLLVQLGRYSEAAAAARRAVYLDRKLVMGHIALGDALARLGDADNARRSFRVALRLLSSMQSADLVPVSGGEAAARVAAAVSSRVAALEAEH